MPRQRFLILLYVAEMIMHQERIFLELSDRYGWRLIEESTIGIGEL